MDVARVVARDVVAVARRDHRDLLLDVVDLVLRRLQIDQLDRHRLTRPLVAPARRRRVGSAEARVSTKVAGRRACGTAEERARARGPPRTHARAARRRRGRGARRAARTLERPRQTSRARRRTGARRQCSGRRSGRAACPACRVARGCAGSCLPLAVGGGTAPSNLDRWPSFSAQQRPSTLQPPLALLLGLAHQRQAETVARPTHRTSSTARSTTG